MPVSKILAAIAVVIATVALVVALSQPEPVQAPATATTLTIRPDTPSKCAAAGGVWVPDGDPNDMVFDAGACAL